MITTERPAGARGAARLAAALALGCAAAAQAETGPYSIGLSETLARETNLVRRPQGQPALGDTVSTTALLGGFDRGIGRQRVYFNGSVRRSVYRDNPVYDNTGYQLSSGLDWSTVHRVSGTLSLAASRSLAPFGFNSAFAPDRNVLSSRQLNAVARVGSVTPLTLESSFSHQSVSYSAPSFKFAEFSQNSAGINLLWRRNGQLTVGTGLRVTRGEYPQGAFGNDHFTGRNVDVSLDWTPAAASSLAARVGYARTRHDDAAQRDFSGITANLQWLWQPSGKWRLTTQYTRATGEDATFFALSGSSPGFAGLNSRVSDTLALNAAYLATGKITLEGNYSQVHRALSRSSSIGASATAVAGTDDTRVLGLTARYAATRTLQFSCNVGRDRRTASSALSYGYTASYASCTAQLSLQP